MSHTDTGAAVPLIQTEEAAGFTYQYLQLNALLRKLQDQNYPISILGVPCNQFGHQEPAANRTELYNSMRYVRPGKGYVPNLNLTARSNVNGKEELELYTFLKAKCPSPGHASYPKEEEFWDPIKPTDISWNFEKFVVGPRGHPLLRFMPDVEPLDLLPILLDPAGDGLQQELDKLEATAAQRFRKIKHHSRMRHHQ